MAVEAAIPEPIRVLPPGPFPPHGDEAEGTVDLGVRARDQLYSRELVIGAARKNLGGQLASAWKEPSRAARAMHLIEPYLLTWPLGAMVDDARRRWTAGPDAEALAVLARCAEIVGVAVGWPTSIDRRWPMPDPEWMGMQVPDVPVVVTPRWPGDGTFGTVVSLRIPVGKPQRLTLPPHRSVPSDELGARRDELLEALDRGDIVAVRWTGPPPSDAADQAALDEIRRHAPVQEALERYGLAGLEVGRAVKLEDLLGTAPAGRPGARLVRACEAMMLPTLTREGRIEPIGALAWDAPVATAMVVPAAIEVLRRLDGSATAGTIASDLGVPEDVIGRVLDQLVELGAATAA